MRSKNLWKTFQSPGSEYRGKPFWAWNGLLDEEELRRQIRVMKQMGLGGFFMHSRVGLRTPYLSDEWFRHISACVDEARKLGMEAWLYDEDRWPSGFAGGLVTKNPKYRARHMAAHRIPAGDFRWSKDIAAAYSAEKAEKYEITGIKRLKRGGAAPEGSTVIACAVGLARGEEKYNGYTCHDTLSHEAKPFIEIRLDMR